MPLNTPEKLTGEEQATELIHISVVAMFSGVGVASVFSRVCFNYPKLGDLYKYAMYDALLKRDGIISNDSESYRWRSGSR